MMPEPIFWLTTLWGSDDYTLFTEVWNQGIDARLEAFTESSASRVEGRFQEPRLKIEIANHHELQILVRRLLEIETEAAEQWADDIIESVYEVEVI